MDEDDEPEPGAVVIAFKQVYHDGRKHWDRLNSSFPANDAGEYRVHGLVPGRYLLQAMVRRQQPYNRYGDGDVKFYYPVYYRSASTQQEAVPVDVGVGADVRGTDIRLFKVARPPSVHVRGRIVGMPPNSPTVVGITLNSAEEALFGGGSTIARSPSYAFDLTTSPGRYTIRAHVYEGGPEAYGSASLTVAGDLPGVVVAMSPAPEITGRLSLAESGGKVNLQGVRVTLDDFPNHWSVQEARSDAAGKLVFAKPFRPGHYAMDVQAYSIPDGCFVREVKLGGQEVPPYEFELLASTQLEIVFSNTAATLAGLVTDADGKPFPTSSVTLIPTDGKSRALRKQADDNGAFRFTGLRPGKYSLYAWEEVDDDLWQDPEFRKKYDDRVTEIAVGPSETQTAQLRVIVAEEMK